ATLVEKLLINGIDVHQAIKPFVANGREYRAGSWVILMDQPFAPLVKELFETQRYPDMRESPNGPPILPYDVAGWTLPMQMGVETAVVAQPVNADQRAGLRLIEKAEAPPGGVQGTGSIFAISHRMNASFKVINEAIAAGGKVGFAAGTSLVDDQNAGDMIVSG